ncbi:hypothetical protein LIER_12945 [Lithospermum erythrorhizon]|uniref:Uncharacterized protein n=1 Tax=Lithospermum erythrorhizon TaxID=34254 RepID=A0AAV3PUD6_LITER
MLKKKATKKSKGKAKRTSIDDLKEGVASKKRKGVFISEHSQCRNKDKFIIDELEESSGEDDAYTSRRKFKGKMKINDDRNRINNRRIAKGIEEMSTEGVDFNSEENEAKWNSVCARNILPESPAVINRNYGRQTKSITGSTLKLADIIKTLTRNALSVKLIGAKLKPIGFPSLICCILIHQHPEIFKARDGSGETAQPLTITDKLISRKRVVDVEIKGADKPAAALKGEISALLIKPHEEEQSMLGADILVKKNRVVELQAKIQALKVPVPPADHDSVPADNPETISQLSIILPLML